MKTLAELLQAHMTAKNYTAAEMGRRVGLSGDTIARYLEGSEPTLTAVRRLRAELGLTADELIDKLPALPAVKYKPARPRGRPPVKRKRKEPAR